MLESLSLTGPEIIDFRGEANGAIRERDELGVVSRDSKVRDDAWQTAIDHVRMTQPTLLSLSTHGTCWTCFVTLLHRCLFAPQLR
jgi:hypothetical protein